MTQPLENLTAGQVPAAAPEATHSHSWRKWLWEIGVAAAWALIFALAVDIALHPAASEPRPECGAAVSPASFISGPLLSCPDRPKPRAEVRV